MEKSATVSLRIDPVLKEESETFLKKMGLSMTSAVTMFLNQMLYEQAIPFKPCLPKEVNADLMTGDELRKDIMDGYYDVISGNYVEAKDVLKK